MKLKLTALLALIAVLSAVAAPRPRFTVTDLGTLPGGYQTFANKINRHGHIVGSTYTADGSLVPFIYRDGVMTQITGFPSGQGTALNINDSSAVVGQLSARGFLYQDGLLTDLNPFIGLDWVAAAGINNSGQIVGWTGETNGVFPAFLLDGTRVHFLPMLPQGYSSQAYEINEAGQAAGDCAFFIDTLGNVRSHAVLFQNGDVIDLGVLPGGLSSAARAINEHGVVVGWSGIDFRGPDVANGTHAVIYHQGQITDLGTLPGDINAFAYDINNAGWVVGASEGTSENARAFLYANGRLYDLNDLIKRNLGWTLGSANGINDRGQIVGWGRRNGEYRGFLLTPDKL